MGRSYILHLGSLAPGGVNGVEYPLQPVQSVMLLFVGLSSGVRLVNSSLYYNAIFTGYLAYLLVLG